MHEGECIKDEAGVAFPGSGSESFRNGPGVHPLPDHLSGGDDEKACPGGEIAAVHDMDMPQFLCREAAVLIGTGQGAAEIDMDDLKAFFHPWAEMIDIFLCVYRGGLWKNLMIIIFLIDLLRCDVYIVFVILSVQYDVEGIVVDVVTFF